MHEAPQRRAVDAFTHAVRCRPVHVNDCESWGGVAVCEWDLPWLDGFELLENDDFIIAYHSAGSRNVMAACNGPWIDKFSTPGLISVIPPGRRVNYRIAGRVGFSSIHVPRGLLNGLMGSSFGSEPSFRFAFEDAFASSCMRILQDLAHEPKSCDFPYVHALTRALVLHILRAFETEKSPETTREPDNDSGVKLNKMLDFIDSHLADPLSINDLADLVGVSRAHFARRFRTLTGVSPHRYITTRRVERAKQLLHEPAACLADVALDAGFSSQSHFAQVFREITQQTPSEYRKRLAFTPNPSKKRN